MSISILGGHASGHALFVPKGDSTRPTTVMLRRRFFDAHQDCSGLIFVDICAGTGAMGLEALSRGASEVLCVEKNKHVIRVLKSNAEAISKKVPEAKVKIDMASADQWLERFLRVYKTWDEEKRQNTYLYIDPPYELKDLYKKCLTLIKESEFEGVLWIESDRQKGILEKDINSVGYQFAKVYKQGTSFIARLSSLE
ncbi:RsmD family RNA methyltransferase [Bacteriovorax sp. DB6_IX]|uniref:RsmD family RNA methyltransferase n=1 Tax=Bacteriovorax sp. DB6_IX TaxID=1353530 RepID=UPI00038A1CE6|nr:RsmD family RNA methyltransferase [Bacteriovorax sp. DB6_IX]EQC50551.1 putative 16S rRNA (guanine(966)-N(2))-methyltransferase RsmD [Bacteriovorax sp. DB6_IX]